MVELEKQGYSWAPIGARLRLMAELSCWLAMRDQESGALTSSLVEQFLATARASGGGAAVVLADVGAAAAGVFARGWG